MLYPDSPTKTLIQNFFNMSKNKFTGMGVALITPFNDDGSIDYDAFERLIDYQMKNFVDYFVILGTTAETPTLSEEEKQQIIKITRTKTNGKIPIVAGIGSNNTRQLADYLHKTPPDGIDAILSVAPYYNKPSQEGIYQHFHTISEASKLPIILYNIPGRTGVNISAETTLKLAHNHSNIIAIKEASGDLQQISDILRHKPKEFNVISGDDALAYSMITKGAIGVISVIGNAFPREFGEVIHLALAGEQQKAAEKNNLFKELFELLFVDGNPAGVKCILHLMGRIQNNLRLPLVPIRNCTCNSIQSILKKLENSQ